jgi:hypothetical protein
MVRKKSINLLIDRGAPPTIWERAYDWVTGSARIVVIVTELIVLLAFGWRFYLDRSLNDLNERISKKGNALKSLSDDEDEIRIIQAKLNTYRELWTVSSTYAEVISEINNFMPTGISEASISIQEDETTRKLSIRGSGPRDKIQELETSLKNSTTFTDVELKQLEGEGGGEENDEFVFTAKVILNLIRQVGNETN